MDAIRARLRAGGAPTCEELQTEAMRVFSEEGVLVDDVVLVSAGAQTTVGHEPGHGPIGEGEPIVVDLFPRDPVSGCYADMTRTFCLGEPPEELVRYHALVREALDLAFATIRPGISGAEAHRIVCELFEEHGFETQLSKTPGEVLEEGFFHSLGHGVGLEVHELPGSVGPGRRSSPATSSRSSPASTGRASAAAGWRTSSSSRTTAARF